MATAERSTPINNYLDAECEAAPECRMVLVGKTGVGKSSTGNTVLGRTAFISEAGATRVTLVCQLEKEVREGKAVHVVDTPGIFDICFSNEVVAQEIIKCVIKSYPGPHAFILVMRIGRFTEEDEQTFATFEKIFGKDMYRHAIVLFTGKDDIDFDGKNIQKYTKDSPPQLSEILSKCENRYLAFNNRGSTEARDAMCRELLRMIDRLVAAKHGSYYTNLLFEKVEPAMREKTRMVMDECAADRSLSIENKRSRRRQYENFIKQLSEKLDSMAPDEEVSTTGSGAMEVKMLEMQVKLLEMQVKLLSLETYVNKETMGNVEMQKSKDRLSRVHIDEKKNESNFDKLIGVTKTVMPHVMTILPSILGFRK